jgi:hypothetical protein
LKRKEFVEFFFVHPGFNERKIIIEQRVDLRIGWLALLPIGPNDENVCFPGSVFANLPNDFCSFLRSVSLEAVEPNTTGHNKGERWLGD